MKNKFEAFTLAEILLTLVIIGIVAALTIPIVSNQVQKQQYTSRFIKSYSLFDSAIKNIMEQNYGTMSNAVNDGDDLVNKLGNVLSLKKKCLNLTASGNCFPVNVSNLSQNNVFATGAYSGGVLNDGTHFYIGSLSTDCTGPWFSYNGQNIMCTQIDIDTNGLNGPNIYGRDVFKLALTRIGIYPHRLPVGNNNIPSYSGGLWSQCEPSRTDWPYNGHECAGRIAQEGWKMNY